MGKPKAKPSKNNITRAKTKQFSSSKKTHKKQKNSFNKKNLSIIIAICAAIVIAISIICGVIFNQKRIATEENRNYFINIDENFSFDCNLQEIGYSLRCATVEISGEYSNFETVYFSDGNKIDSISDGKFIKKVNSSFGSSIYQKENFDINALENFKIEKLTFNLMNSVLGKEVATKNVQVKFNLTASDKELIAKKNQEWRNEKAEEEAKKQAEAERRRVEEEQRKAEEEQRRVEEERKAAEEKAAKEAAEKSTFPNSEMSTAMDICTDQFYYSKGISIVPALKNWKNSFWSGNDFVQTINIADGKIRIVCQYNWKEKTATITDWSYL